MRITWLGHACFMVENEDYRVVIDPFRDVPGFRDVAAETDAVLCSHGHFDHNYCDRLTLREGKENPFTVETVETFHDDKEGVLRGKNTIHALRTGGQTVVHLGDLGHLLTEEQAAGLRCCDVLLIPVGGTYTVDADAAAEVVKTLQPRLVIPMHYRGDDFGFDNIDTVAPFLAYFAPEMVHFSSENSVTVDESMSGVLVLAKPV